MDRYWDDWDGGDAVRAVIDHVICSYLDSLRPKAKRAVEVPFEHREQFQDIDCPH